MSQFKKGDRVLIIDWKETGTVSHVKGDLVVVIPDHPEKWKPIEAKQTIEPSPKKVDFSDVKVFARPEDLRLILTSDETFVSIWDKNST